MCPTKLKLFGQIVPGNTRITMMFHVKELEFLLVLQVTRNETKMQYKAW
jgi:hypothetical protein